MKLKKSIGTLVIMVGLFTFTSCGNGQKQPSENESAKHEKAAERSDHDKAQSEELSQEQMKKVLAGYFALKDALVQTNGEQASNLAMNLVEAVGKKEGALIGKIRIDAESIYETKDVDLQRDLFYTLSDNVYSLIKEASPIEKTIYRQYCPMAMNNEGAFWLSLDEEIRNPYFGDQMLTCGSVKEEIR